MKLYPFAFAGISALVVGALPQPAQALPFKPNCASMQSYFNSSKWEPRTMFQGFQNNTPEINKVFNARDSITCGRGYITEYSPMGTKVCKGWIKSYADPKTGRRYTTWEADGECRYK